MDKPKFDVQRALAAMADYPAVLRRFGVIRVLEIDLAGSQINPATAGEAKITATPTWTKKIEGDRLFPAPMTTPAYLSATQFALTPDSRIDLATAKVTVSEVDSDSAAARLLDLARQVVNAEQANEEASDAGLLPPMNKPKQLALPPMRNAGLALAQGDRASELRQQLVDGQPFHRAIGPKTLANPQQGYMGQVLDVWDDRTSRWHTVCARRGTYKLPGGATFTLDDEGSVSLGATAKEDANSFSTMFLHQSLVRWTGWSLVAPRPGKPVPEDDAIEPDPGDPALPGFDPTFEPVPGSLPTLRFGVGYRFQLRRMDLVGRTDPLVPTSTDFSRATPLVKYRRFEPIVSPIVVAAAPMTEGESIETLVHRPEPWAGGSQGSDLSPIPNAQPMRHIVPPKVPVLLCEEPGKFDRPNGTPDPAKYQMIATRDAAGVETMGQLDPGRPNQRYVSANSVPVTWLPDPLSRGAALSGLPTGLLKFAFEAWPEGKSLRIRLQSGNQPPQWASGTRMLTIYMPSGEMRTVRLSSYLNDTDLALLGQLAWLAESGATQAELTAASADILKGQAWQITPYRTLTLVNAVRVPVTAPALTAVEPKARAEGSTEQELTVKTSLHQQSTGLLSLHAKWTDPVDDLSQDGPSTVTAKATPLVLPVDYGTASTMEFPAKHAFGDTKRHKVDYTIEGTTRYMEYFVQRGKIKLTGTTAVEVAKSGIATGSDVLKSLDDTKTFRRDQDYTVTGGKIARTPLSEIPDGATVNVAIVALPVSRVSAAAITRDLPSTARPLPPKVSWIVPTFGWKESSSNLGRTKSKTRSGGGLRVFLERGWYSSGVGEQLAVVLSNGGTPSDPRLLALLTQAGADPTVKTNAAQRFPAASEFTLGTAHKDIVPAELDTSLVSVAAHDVVWDAQRRRWACDIVLPPQKVYQPFVSLMLARFQPNSIAKMHLSPIANVEWAQLAPDRTATVAMDMLDLTRVKVTVAGQSGTGTDAANTSPNRVSVIVQTAFGLNPRDLDWQISGPATGTELTATMSPDGFTTWTGTLNLGISRLLRPHRLVIVEHERNSGGGRLIYSDVIRI